MCCCDKTVASVISLFLFALGLAAFAYRYVDFELLRRDFEIVLQYAEAVFGSSASSRTG